MPSIELSLIQSADLPKRIDWERCDELPYVARAVQTRAQSASTPPAIGLAIHLNKEAALELVGLCVLDKVFVIPVSAPKSKNKQKASARLASATALARLFSGELGQLAGFDVDRSAAYINNHLDCRVVASNLSLPKISPGQAVRDTLDPSSDSYAIDQVWDFEHEELESGEETRLLVLRAWISSRLAAHPQWRAKIGTSLPIDTASLPQSELSVIHRMMTEAERIEFQKPRARVGDTEAAAAIHHS